MKRIIGSLLIASCVVGASACGSNTSIEQSWQSSAQHASLRRVATVMMSPSATTRRTAEEAMAQRLRAQGVDAVPAYTILSEQDYANRDAARAKLQANGFDGVIAMQLLSAEQSLRYTPTFDNYWGYGYGYGYRYGWDGGGYYDTETQVLVETDVYSLRDQAPVYSMTSSTLDPSDIGNVIHGVTKKVASALQKQGVVAAASPRSIPAG